jgi:hypothetical protein
MINVGCWMLDEKIITIYDLRLCERCPPLALLRTLSPKLQRKRPKRLREGKAP